MNSIKQVWGQAKWQTHCNYTNLYHTGAEEHHFTSSRFNNTGKVFVSLGDYEKAKREGHAAGKMVDS